MSTATPAVSDPRMEVLLRDHGVSFELIPDFDLTKINRSKSHRNQGRIEEGPIDEDHALAMAIAVEEGATLPPMVIYEDRAGDAVIIDGNHRDHAYASLQQDQAPVYYLGTLTPNQVKLLTYGINLQNGKNLTFNERLHHALDFIASGVMSKHEAARFFGIDDRKLQAATMQAEAEERLRSAGVRSLKTLSPSHLVRLDAIRLDKVMVDAAKLTMRARLTTDELNELVTDVNRQRTESAMAEVIKAAQAQYDQQSRGSALRVPAAIRKLRNAVKAINDVDVDALEAAVQEHMTAKQRKAFSATLHEAGERLATIEESISS